MQKKYIVRLSKQERITLQEVVKKLTGSGEKVRRAQILLKADVDGPAWSDSRIAESFACRRQTVEMLRERFVESGFQETLDRKKRVHPPTEKLLDGEQEAKIIATRLGPRPESRSRAPPSIPGASITNTSERVRRIFSCSRNHFRDGGRQRRASRKRKLTGHLKWRDCLTVATESVKK